MEKMVKYFLTLLRIVLGWYFLFEGISKILVSGWTSKNYLLGSTWIFSDFFYWLASSPTLVGIVDFLNIWGLILIGISLFVGLYVRWASLFAAILLFFLSADMTCGLDRSPRSRRKDWLSVVVNC